MGCDSHTLLWDETERSIPWTQGRYEVKYRSGQETSLGPPMFDPKVFRKHTCCWRKYLRVRHCWDFSVPLAVVRRPHSDSASGELCPLYPPSHASAWTSLPISLTLHKSQRFSRKSMWQRNHTSALTDSAHPRSLLNTLRTGISAWRPFAPRCPARYQAHGD